MEDSSYKTNEGGSVRLRLYATQHIRDIELLKNLARQGKFLGCGGYYERSGEKPVGDYIVTNFKDIYEKIIPLFDKYPLQGAKSQDFAQRVAELMKNKAHLNESGLKKIRLIKSVMNKNRKLESDNGTPKISIIAPQTKKNIFKSGSEIVK